MNWEKIKADIIAVYPFTAPMLNVPVQVNGNSVTLLYDRKKQKAMAELAEIYKNEINEAANRISDTLVSVKIGVLP